VRLREAGEGEFLRRVREAAGRPGGSVLVGIGDDTAVLQGQGREERLLLKCDATVEGQHFRREWLTEAEIGARAVRRALSDIAAMGGRPAAILLTLLVSPDEDLEAATAIAAGAAAAGTEFGAPLAGGETVGTEGPLALDVVVAGFAPAGRELRRSGARPGEALLVSGALGASAAGLACLRCGLSAPAAHRAIARSKRPEPRLALGRMLRESGAVRAAIDLSDGLLRDAGHLADESGVRIEIDEARLPLSPDCREVAEALGASPLHWALAGGEDYELLFTADAESVPALIAQADREVGLSLTRIGAVTQGRGVFVARPDGGARTPTAEGWDQFTHDQG
jgi:thiamine-monophosphate kinase